MRLTGLARFRNAANSSGPSSAGVRITRGSDIAPPAGRQPRNRRPPNIVSLRQFFERGPPWADTGTSTGRLMIAVLGGLADVERDLIPHPDSRSQKPRQGPRAAHGPTAEANTAAAERGPPAPRGGSAKDRNCALASTICLTMANRSNVERARRSIRVTVTMSPGATALSILRSSRRSARAPVTFSR